MSTFPKRKPLWCLRLRKAKKILNVTYEDIVEASGVSMGTVQRIMKGNDSVALFRLECVATVLGLRLWDLFQPKGRRPEENG